jgi:guanylate kinase
MAGKLFVISGPSGAGKGSIVEKLMAKDDKLYFSISATTRPKRDYETDGREYFFVSREEFLDRIEKGKMLEWAEYAGNYYGTPAGPVDEKLNAGCDVILDVESHGMYSVKALRPDAVTMFVYPPSFAELERRLRKRNTETEERIQSRLKQSRLECAHAQDYDYIIINDDLELAAEEARAIMTAEKCRTAERLHILKEDKTL